LLSGWSSGGWIGSEEKVRTRKGKIKKWLIIDGGCRLKFLSLELSIPLDARRWIHFGPFVFHLVLYPPSPPFFFVLHLLTCPFLWGLGITWYAMWSRIELDRIERDGKTGMFLCSSQSFVCCLLCVGLYFCHHARRRFYFTPILTENENPKKKALCPSLSLLSATHYVVKWHGMILSEYSFLSRGKRIEFAVIQHILWLCWDYSLFFIAALLLLRWLS
jgi:hypothetical protein